MNERTTKEMFEIYMKYALEYGVDNDEDNLIEMWNEDDDTEDVRMMRIDKDNKQLVEGINAENLTTEEKIYIALKVGMLM